MGGGLVDSFDYVLVNDPVSIGGNPHCRVNLLIGFVFGFLLFAPLFVGLAVLLGFDNHALDFVGAEAA